MFSATASPSPANPIRSIEGCQNLIIHTLTASIHTHMHTHRRTHAQTYGKRMGGDIFTRQMSPAVGVAPPAEMAFAHIPTEHMRASCSRIHGIEVDDETRRGSSRAPGGGGCAIHCIQRNVWADGGGGGRGGLVVPLMLIWQKTDWDITAEARGNQPAQVRCMAFVHICEGETGRKGGGRGGCSQSCLIQRCQIKQIAANPLCYSDTQRCFTPFCKICLTLMKSASWEPL